MIINIVSGSPTLSLELVKKHKCDFLIGVDYGAYQLIQNDIMCNVCIGDFDSINEADLNLIKEKCDKVLIHPVMKDETDTEIALNYALSLNPSEIHLFGVTGRRIDHFLGAFYLFKKTLPKDVPLYIIDDNNRLYVLKPGRHTITKSDYKYHSFFSFSECVTNLTLDGFKYPLTNHSLKNENSLCLSNEILGEYGNLQFDDGLLLIVESDD